MKINTIFFLGTKAQFIKTIPIINSTDLSKMNIYIYDTQQHREITKNQMDLINKEFKYVNISKNNISADSITKLFFWFCKVLVHVFKKKYKPETQTKTICLIHGNTLSTIAGLIWAKYNKVDLIHIEGGYTSGNWLRPFPEELIRYFVSKFSDYVICFDERSKNNLIKLKISGKIKQVNRNTIYDSIKSNLGIQESFSKLTISIHRNENIYNKKRLKETVDFIIYLKKNYFEKVNWYLHKQTKRKLKNYKLLKKLFKNDISLIDLVEHSHFINELKTSKCVFTDGESVLEECQILGVPTYALVNNLENQNSNGRNIFISKYSHYENLYFFDNIEKYFEDTVDNLSISPSQEIIDYIEEEFI